MAKVLNWDAIANVNFDEKRRKATGLTTGKELFAKAYDNLRKSEEAIAQRQKVEPLLKSILLDHMLNKKVITLTAAIKNPTEAIAGTVANSEDDDGFYNTSPSASAESSASSRFEECMETIPAGTQLMYKSWDRTMGQWIFKGNNGKEYAIYDKSVIIYKGNAIENPGLFGLLYNTNLVSLLGED